MVDYSQAIMVSTIAFMTGMTIITFMILTFRLIRRGEKKG